MEEFPASEQFMNEFTIHKLYPTSVGFARYPSGCQSVIIILMKLLQPIPNQCLSCFLSLFQLTANLELITEDEYTKGLESHDDDDDDDDVEC